MTTITTAPVTAATVRAYFRADEARMARLSDEARATVQVGARGRLHAKAISEFNGKRKAHRRYVLGSTAAVKADRMSVRAELRARGLAGARGRLSAAALASLAE